MIEHDDSMCLLAYVCVSSSDSEGRRGVLFRCYCYQGGAEGSEFTRHAHHMWVSKKTPYRSYS